MIYVYWRYKYHIWNIMKYSEDPINHDADRCLIRCKCILLGFTIWPVGLSEQGKTPRFTGESWFSLFELPFLTIYHHHIYIYIYIVILLKARCESNGLTWTSLELLRRHGTGRERAALPWWPHESDQAEAIRKIDTIRFSIWGYPKWMVCNASENGWTGRSYFTVENPQICEWCTKCVVVRVKLRYYRHIFQNVRRVWRVKPP